MPAKKTSAETKPKKTASGNSQSVHEVAYEIYQKRIQNNEPGDEISDWVKAEKSVNTKSK